MIWQRVSFDFCLSFVSRAGRCRKWMEFQQIAGMVNCEQPIRRSLPLSQKCTVHKKFLGHTLCQSVHCSVSRGLLTCVRTLGLHWVSYFGLNLVQYSQVYIGVPWFAPISTGCSMHLLWSSTGVPWCRVHWCIPGVHWKARNQFGARVRATRPAPQSPLLWPHGHSCGTGQGGGWGGPDPPHQDWGDPHPTNKTPSSCPTVQWLQAGGPKIEEVLGPFWEVQQVEGGGPGRAEDVGPGGAPLHSGRLLLLPSLGCGKPSSGEIMIMQEMQDYFRQWNMKTIYFGIFKIYMVVIISHYWWSLVIMVIWDYIILSWVQKP